MSAVTALPLLPVREPARTPVSVFVTPWGLRGLLIRLSLLRTGVAHRCIDVIADPDAMTGIPVVRGAALPIVSVDGEWLASPTLGELKAVLRRRGLL